jgi:hypothetical protein
VILNSLCFLCALCASVVNGNFNISLFQTNPLPEISNPLAEALLLSSPSLSIPVNSATLQIVCFNQPT